MRSPLSNHALIAALSFTAATLAQNDTTNSTCSNQDLIDGLETGLANSTSSVEFSFPEADAADVPWHLSVYVNDTRNSTVNGQEPNGLDITVQPYLSVSNRARNVSACVYRFSSWNETSEGNTDDSIGCAGLFSNECTAHFKKIHEKISKITPTGRCPLAWQTDQDRKEQKEACGSLMLGYSTTFVPVTQDNCSLPTPEAANVSESETFNTFPIDMGFSPYWDERWTDTANASATYDLAVHQTIPFVVVAKFSQSDSDDAEIMDAARMFCITPNKVVDGSRIPESEEPWESGAVDKRVGGTVSLVVAVMIAFVFL